MEQIIKKYIQRIKVDFPEDDKLYLDLQDFIKEAEQSRQADVIGTLPLSKVEGLLKALKDIKDWDDDLEDEWEDQGYRAIAALKDWTS